MSIVKTYDADPVLPLPKKAHNHAGTRLGKLTIDNPIYRDGQHLYWSASCACGTRVAVRASQITAGKIDSCGICQNLPYVTLQELPHRVKDTMEQGELKLEADIDLAFGAVPTENHDSTPFDAWGAAKLCCDVLGRLPADERAKATQLMQVQLGGYEQD